MNETQRRMKEYLLKRQEVLKANKADRPISTEEEYTEWQETNALNWLSKENKGDRSEEEELVYLFVSSALRDPIKYPNAGDFKLTLAAEVNNVIRAELVQASIPLVDSTIHESNNSVRYALSPFTGSAVKRVRIPPGSYLGKDLAVEITRQLNQDLHSSDILSNSYLVDETTGAVQDASTGDPPVGEEQFKVSWDKSRQMMIFQLVDEDLRPVNTQFALHFKPHYPDLGKQQPKRFMYDDLSDALGFDRIVFGEVADALSQADLTNGTYYLTNAGSSDAFNGVDGVSNAVDLRYRYSLHSNQAVDLRGNVAVILDIDPLNDNDIASVRDTAGTGALALSDYFGFVLLRDPAAVTDRMSDMTNNSFPIKKYYREGRSRINSIRVRMRRPDGTIFNFGGVDFYLTIRLTVKRTVASKSMFARG